MSFNHTGFICKCKICYRTSITSVIFQNTKPQRACILYLKCDAKRPFSLL